jgi:hypothetical protein
MAALVGAICMKPQVLNAPHSVVFLLGAIPHLCMKAAVLNVPHKCVVFLSCDSH